MSQTTLNGATPQTRETIARSVGTSARPDAADVSNPIRNLIAIGRMPIILELPVTEVDLTGYQDLRKRHLAGGYELTELTLLGQYLRQLDISRDQLTDPERKLVRKLQIYADLLSSGKIDLVGIDDGARARNVLDNSIVVALLAGLGADPGRIMPHVVARNRQSEQIRSRLMNFARLGVRNALLLTGDLPDEPGVIARFPMDSTGMCELARRMQIEGDLPEEFLITAAGHPNPDSDPHGLRVLHKALAGARVIITQAIYNLEYFKNWMESLARNGALDMVHVIAEIIPPTSGKQLRSIAEVPGIRIPAAMIAQFDGIEQRLQEAAKAGGRPPEWQRQQLRQEAVRISRQLFHQVRRVRGVSGMYMGSVGYFDIHLELLKETPLVPEYSEGLHKKTRLSGPEGQRVLAQLPAVEDLVRKMLSESASPLRKGVENWAAKMAKSPAFIGFLKLIESPKIPLFGCKKCDRCDLSPDALVCPRGCAKQMSHGPCGAPRFENGRMLCEDTSRECTWAEIRRRREQYGVPLSDRLEIQSHPSPGFYEGKTFSSFLPALLNQKRGPNWQLAWRVPAARLIGLVKKDFRFPMAGSPLDLSTLAESKCNQMRSMINANPHIDSEELLVKVLALIGNAGAIHLIESRLVPLGLPAEGTLFDLSTKEVFQIAEALPAIRRRMTETLPETNTLGSRSEAILAAIGQGRQLRKAMRRELANILIEHIAALGVRVTYAEDMLNPAQVDDFLAALTVLKDELLVVRPRLAAAGVELQAYFTRIHYRNHYRAPITTRKTYDVAGNPASPVMLIVDMKQCQTSSVFRAHVRESLSCLAERREQTDLAIVMEPFAGESHSLCWEFNNEFWRRLRDFEQAAGVKYDESVGGSIDRNMAYVRSTARWYFDRVHEQKLGDEQLYVLEIGVASTQRAAAFMEEYRRICDLTGTAYYENTTFLLADFHEDILHSATEELRKVHPRVQAVRMDAANPIQALQPYKGQILYTHLCNVYDNLPSDKLLRQDGKLYLLEGRLFLRNEELERIAGKHRLDEGTRDELRRRLSPLAPQGRESVGRLLDFLRDVIVAQGREPLDYVHLWMDLFAAFRMEERYVEIADPGQIPLTIPGVSNAGEIVASQLAASRSMMVHLNQSALSGFAELLSILHPCGTLEVLDLFVQRLDEYTRGFRGPAKYDGSTVNWLNGPLFRAIAETLGFSVRLNSFRPYDSKSVAVIMLATRQVPTVEFE